MHITLEVGQKSFLEDILSLCILELYFFNNTIFYYWVGLLNQHSHTYSIFVGLFSASKYLRQL